MRNDRPSPTEVISAWIPHDSRWHESARSAAITGEEQLRRYVTGLLIHRRDGDRPLVDEYDLFSIGAVVEDLGVNGLMGVDWRFVRDAILVPLRARGLV
ncbi:hypothetical protein Q8791_27460 [Nocardiopsis sp. CT-R113]|uniref:Uncharacterized protein n=1 Tax=Nocardiopsis codii TaxID=3065942 RepID=A0ABU7KFH0_9ACTN|nr:hypothetical protein [Nocardiopsis sp. CT-R113]MEE2040965.1 hypothetical protein [Nocardiopsis sp. CT-R113]